MLKPTLHLLTIYLLLVCICAENPDPIIPNNCKIINYLYKCVECKEDFILIEVENLCIHKSLVFVSVQGCKNYDQDEPLQCSECESELILLETQNLCVTYQEFLLRIERKEQEEKKPELVQIQIIEGSNPQNIGVETSDQKNPQESTLPQTLPQDDKDLNCKIEGALQGSPCQECYQGFYYATSVRKCMEVDPICKQSNKFGHCTACWAGYKVGGFTCIADQLFEPNCFRYNGSKCIFCAYRFFFSDSGRCKQVSVNCDQWYIENGQCSSCFKGYTLDKEAGKCLQEILTQEGAVANPQKQIFIETSNSTKYNVKNCNKYNPDGDCVKCSFKHYLSFTKCEPVDDLCKKWDEDSGQCTDCFSGFDLENGKCVKPDPYCEVKNNYVCEKCLDRYYLDVAAGGRCMLVDGYCKDYVMIGGECKECHPGLELVAGKCLL